MMSPRTFYKSVRYAELRAGDINDQSSHNEIPATPAEILVTNEPTVPADTFKALPLQSLDVQVESLGHRPSKGIKATEILAVEPPRVFRRAPGTAPAAETRSSALSEPRRRHGVLRRCAGAPTNL